MSTPEKTQELLQKQDKPRTLQGMVEESAKELARALPEHMRPERIVRIALTCIRQTPDLAKCTPESFLGALFTAAQLGVEPIGGRAYLLPFNNNRKKPDGSWHTVKEAQFVLGYKGVTDLFFRHEKSVGIYWGIRKKNDVFEIENGTDPRLRHIQGDGDRGETVGYWVVAQLAQGGKPFTYMTREECMEHGRKHSKTYNKKKNEWYENSPWLTEPDAMCLKTVLVQLMKILPLSVELQRAVDADETARDFRRGIDNVLDIPDQVNWDAVEKEVQEKQKDQTSTETDFPTNESKESS
jgi:recombination protein RecT